MKLPYDLVEKIADMVDIDTRRHMGFPPRKLCIHRMKAVEDMVKHRIAMQYRSLEKKEHYVFSCTTVLPVSNKKLIYFSYSMLFNKTSSSMMTFEHLDDVALVEYGIMWNGSQKYNIVHVSHPFAPEQTVRVTSCVGFYANLTPANKNILRPLLTNTR